MAKEGFYRNAKNINEYLMIKAKYPYFLNYLEFTIVKKIKLSKKMFLKFIDDLRTPQVFIQDNVDLMHMDEYDKLTCILIYCKYFSFGILVYSAGYSYARYIAICDK